MILKYRSTCTIHFHNDKITSRDSQKWTFYAQNISTLRIRVSSSELRNTETCTIYKSFHVICTYFYHNRLTSTLSASQTDRLTDTQNHIQLSILLHSNQHLHIFLKHSLLHTFSIIKHAHTFIPPKYIFICQF